MMRGGNGGAWSSARGFIKSDMVYCARAIKCLGF